MLPPLYFFIEMLKVLEKKKKKIDVFKTAVSHPPSSLIRDC